MSCKAATAQALLPDAACAWLQAGCTAVVAVLKGRHLYVANAGDSRAVLARGDDAMALSEDHKPAAQSEKQRITTAGGFVSEVLLCSHCLRAPPFLPHLPD